MALGAECTNSQTYISRGRIIVVQTITDINKDYLNAYRQGNGSFYFDILYDKTGPGENFITSTTNLQIINDNTVKVTYSIDPLWSKKLAQTARDEGGLYKWINIVTYFEGNIQDGNKKKYTTDRDEIENGCEFPLTNQDLNAIDNGTDSGNIPSQACNQGCPENQFCRYNGSGDIAKASSWSCQTDSFSQVDVHGSCGSRAIDTALGCIPTETTAFTRVIVTYAIGLAGFTALVIMIIGSIMVLTGGSNPEQVKKGKEIFTSAIMGLLFIIFSAVILKIINQDILGDPLQNQSQPINFNDNQSPYSDQIRNIRQQQGGSL